VALFKLRRPGHVPIYERKAKKLAQYQPDMQDALHAAKRSGGCHYNICLVAPEANEESFRNRWDRVKFTCTGRRDRKRPIVRKILRSNSY
jgi:hypothetical protein